MNLLSSDSACRGCENFRRPSSERTIKSHSSTAKKKFCWFYNTYGHCKFGKNCNFIHASFNRFKRSRGNKLSKESIDKQNKQGNECQMGSTSNFYSSKNSSICHIFKVADCRPANYLNAKLFDHVSDLENFISNEEKVCQIEVDLNADDVLENELNTEFSVPLQSEVVTKPLSQLQEIENMRKTEIILLKKRYPHLNHLKENDDDIFEITFSSSDPDWVFAVKFIQVQVTLKKLYPKEVCIINVQDKNAEMPPLLLRFLNNSINQWLIERHKVNTNLGKYELMLRPLLKWLDRNLEELFIQGLRKVKREIEAEKAGFEFVPHELLPGAVNALSLNELGAIEEQRKETNDASINIENKELPAEDVQVISLSNTSVIPDHSHDCTISTNTAENHSLNVTKRGTEVKLIGLELTNGTASFECKKIYVSLHCTRCKTMTEMLVLPKQCHSATCTKCHKVMQVTFQPSLLHQHSNVLGYLHLFDCQVIDLPLPQCTFFIDCLNCNKRNDIDGIHYGQTLTTWCLHCHQKLSLIVQSCKFQHLQPALRTGKLPVVVSEKKQVKLKEIIVEFGKSLPKNGTCSHYKKSYRWLRFPCCGKLYPCDICHNEAETEHEMKYAARMICGFCSKEQPYSSDKPCVSCTSFTTRKSSKHWEGGKGCRDQIRMSREDKQKFAGINKTVSRRSSQQQKSKKKT